MKLSLAWLLDHIQITKKDVDWSALIKHFNETTAEVDAVETVSTDLATLYAGTVLHVQDTDITLDVPELGKKVVLPLRKGACAQATYLIKKEGSGFRWVTLGDIGSSKDGLLTCLSISAEETRGSWRAAVDQEDMIITIDNKAITNRPDLWSHRGCAREVAALLSKQLVPEEYFMSVTPIKHYETKAVAHQGQQFEVVIHDEFRTCKRLAGLYVPRVDYRASLPWMAFRLARVDFRPLDALVDMTNYVMCDIGQPMHVFDAEKFTHKILEARTARPGETLQLLDGDEITTVGSECVISDGEKLVSLAGIMGGLATSVQQGTHSLFLESGNFDPVSVRTTATRFKKRTESSSRYEKSLDPNQNTQAIMRYIKLLDDAKIAYEAEEFIISLGHLFTEKEIVLSHALIQEKIGMTIDPERVVKILTALEYGVSSSQDIYTITVPTFRATKDVTIPEDIIEEVARFIGYSSIIPHLPQRSMAAFDTRRIECKRRLKHILAYGLAMREVQNYAFYDEEFIRTLGYNPEDALRIINPLSEYWQRLVTSLLPHLLKCVTTNTAQNDSLRFFEVNRVWFLEEHPVETNECAGIWYEQKKTIDFYEGKALVESLCGALGISISWIKPEKQLAVWYDENQSAELWSGERLIGRAGKASVRFLSTVLEGNAFIFELDASFLLTIPRKKVTFVPLSKYPSTHHDLSVLVSLSMTLAQLELAIVKADKRIEKVELVDSFEKPEWRDKKSLTLRITASDPERTLDKEAIEHIEYQVKEAVITLGGVVR